VLASSMAVGPELIHKILNFLLALRKSYNLRMQLLLLSVPLVGLM
jgi:hypothetical protein